VTAVTGYEKPNDFKYVLVTGDGVGNLVASYINYERSTGRLINVLPFFTMEGAHKKYITKIERYKITDIILTASHDCSFSFWNLMAGEQVCHMEGYHVTKFFSPKPRRSQSSNSNLWITTECW
jgi:hypothetical protein